MNFKITAAVAAALACSAPAFALDLTNTINSTVQLTASGASASRDAFLVMMANTVCQAGTFDMYRASPTVGQDFRAYSCRIVNDATAFGAAANQTATVFYRSEGGSAFGAVPVATGVQVLRLNVDTSCTATATLSVPGVPVAVAVHDCALPALDYQLATDTSASADQNLVKRSVDLSVSDLEPKFFAGANYPSSGVFAGVPAGSRQGLLNALNPAAQVGFGQVFGVLVNNVATGAAGNGSAAATASPFNGQTNPVLSREAITGIFNGTYRNWNQVPTVTGGRVSASSLTIRVCRREPGSGTQVSANQYFLGTTQCAPPTPLGSFVTDNGDADDITNGATAYIADTNGVIERGTGGDLNACVGGLAGGIGISVANAAPANTTFVAINNSVPSRNSAAVGQYDYWYEQTFTIRPSLGAGQVADLAQGLINESKNSASAPNVASVISLPNENNDPFGQGTFGAAVPPISFGSRNGNSCTSIAPLSP